jgi:hypothetical protein
MRDPESNGSSVFTPTPPNAFSPAFLEQVQGEEEPLTAAEADLAGPWKVEPLDPEGGRPGAFAVLRLWESVEKGDVPAAAFLHRETAVLCTALLPLLDREPPFSLEDETVAEGPLPGGFAVAALYGEQGWIARGWVRLFRPEVALGLGLLEGLVRSPLLLAAVVEAAGGNAVAQLGRLLPELLAARRSGQTIALTGEGS